MLEPEVVSRLRDALVSAAGGYLRNPVRQNLVTCAVCTTPVDGYERCYACKQHRVYERLADKVGALTYAVGGAQSGYVMRGYKARPFVEEHMKSLLCLLFSPFLTTLCVRASLRTLPSLIGHQCLPCQPNLASILFIGLSAARLRELR